MKRVECLSIMFYSFKRISVYLHWENKEELTLIEGTFWKVLKEVKRVIKNHR